MSRQQLSRKEENHTVTPCCQAQYLKACFHFMFAVQNYYELLFYSSWVTFDKRLLREQDCKVVLTSQTCYLSCDFGPAMPYSDCSEREIEIGYIVGSTGHYSHRL